MNQTIAKVVNNIRILPEQRRPRGRNVLETRLLWLNAPEIAREARPGQFIMVRCGECTTPRPFSLFRVYGSDIALFYAVWDEGKGTAWLAERRTGDMVSIFGPLGNGFTVPADARNILVIAGGIGLAPVFFLAQEAVKRSCAVTLLYGTPDRNRYPIPPEIKTVPATDDGSVGFKGLVTEIIPQYAERADQVYACGPLAMYRSMARYRTELKLNDKPVQVSLETRMGCAVGACYGCSIQTTAGMKRVCREGPVFSLNDILWEQMV